MPVELDDAELSDLEPESDLLADSDFGAESAFALPLSPLAELSVDFPLLPDEPPVTLPLRLSVR